MRKAAVSYKILQKNYFSFTDATEPAGGLFGGVRRSDSIRKVLLMHGDIVVWGGAARLAYHGILPIKENIHPLVGGKRINLTFRKAKRAS